jgi:hypothetical protein
MSTTVRFLLSPWVLLLTLLLLSCRESLPTAPSTLSSGLTVYDQANYVGESGFITESITDLKGVKGPCVRPNTGIGTAGIVTDWNDCISSIRIAPGWHATLYRDSDYDGTALEVTGDLPNLQLVGGDCSHDGMNDCITSIKLTPPR